jgi:hypothetical protein
MTYAEFNKEAKKQFPNAFKKWVEHFKNSRLTQPEHYSKFAKGKCTISRCDYTIYVGVVHGFLRENGIENFSWDGFKQLIDCFKIIEKMPTTDYTN